MQCCAEGGEVWILLFSKVTLFEYNNFVADCSFNWSGKDNQPVKNRNKYNVVNAGKARETRATNCPWFRSTSDWAKTARNLF